MSSAVKEDNGKILISTSALVDVLGVSRRTLINWEEQGCPKATRGWWPLGEVLKWRGLVGNSGPKTSGQVDEASLKEQKLKFETRLKQLQSESMELKNAINQGDYIGREEIINELSRFFITLKRSLSGLSGKITTEIGSYVDSTTARSIEKMLKDTINDCLNQMSVDGVYEPKKERASKSVAPKRTTKPKATRKS